MSQLSHVQGVPPNHGPCKSCRCEEFVPKRFNLQKTVSSPPRLLRRITHSLCSISGVFFPPLTQETSPPAKHITGHANANRISGTTAIRAGVTSTALAILATTAPRSATSRKRRLRLKEAFSFCSHFVHKSQFRSCV